METVKLLLNTLFGLAIFVGIMYLAYLATKYVGKRYSSMGGRSGSNLEIVEAVTVGKDSRLVIAAAGDKYFLLGITSQNISLIKEFSSDELEYVRSEAKTAETMTFAQALKINLSEKFGKDKNISATLEKKTEDSDDDKNGVN